ncbi:MAG: OB-fold nucleic acid binding domain-containing protein [Candidatus Bathyarchaeia archaeon]|jgi:replication factor A1
MSATEDVIKRILAVKPNLTREAVERLIQEEKTKASGLLTDEAAAHLVASNLGMDGAGERIEAKLKIGALTSGLNDVSLTGRVLHLFPSRTFQRADGRQGKVLRMLIGDATGIVAVVFWDDKADHIIASKVTRGKIIRVLHGYSRERQGSGEVEVNVGNRGSVYMEPLDVVDSEFPQMDSFFKTPGQISAIGAINVEGVIMGRSPQSTFTRKDGTEGKVVRLTLEEGGRQITAVLWDEKVEEAAKLSDGTRVRIIGANAKVRQGGGFEIHLNRNSEVEVLEEGVLPHEPLNQWSKIGELKDGMRSVSVAGKVTSVGEPREFTRKDGTKGRVASVVLEDETGVIRLSLWDDDVNALSDMPIGTIVAVENGYTRAGYGNSTDLNVGRLGTMKINPPEVQIEILDAADRITQIKDLKEGQKNITVEGQLLDDPISREVNTMRGPTNVMSFRVDDGTGEARISLWREHGKAVEGLTAGARILLENCNIREPFDGLMQVTSTQFTRIKVLKK